MKKTMLKIAVAAAFALPLTGQATIYEFRATLSPAGEVVVPPAPSPVGVSNGTGIAFLSYNDFGTLDVADDRYSFTMSVSGLSAAATAFHIHGAGTTAENAPVRIFLDDTSSTSPFLSLKSGGSLLVGGNNVQPPAFIPATPTTGVNTGHPEMTFLAMLQDRFAYVNVHTSNFPAGEIRGQLIQVAVVPEPETYALMLAGLGLVGWAAARRRKVGV